MVRGVKFKSVAVFLMLTLVLLYVPGPLQAVKKDGALVGFVFDKDGTTPVEGAVVVIKNIETGEVYQSNGTDSYGVFKISGLEKGIYQFGVQTQEGGFNADDLIGIQSSKTAKMSISLSKFNSQEQQASQETNLEQKKSGETLVGHVVEYDIDRKAAVVLMTKGSVKNKDKLHFLGNITDFYQLALGLFFEGKEVNRVFKDQLVEFTVEFEVLPGDNVYIVRKQGLSPLFLIPVGVIAAIGGIITITDGDDEKKETVFIK